MGTSGIYKGQKDGNPLLPDWLESELDSKDSDVEKTERVNSWQNSKKLMSQYVTGSNKNLGGVLKAYVGAHGGSKRTAQTSIAGKSTAIALGRFMSSANSNSFKETLSNYGIEYDGRPLLNVLSDLGNKLGPSGSLKEDDIARKALFGSIEELYMIIDDESNEIEKLEDLTDKHMDFIMENYISRYIFERILNDLESRIEEYGDDAASIEKDIRDYVNGNVHNELRSFDITKLDYNSPKVNELVQNLFELCYRVLEVSI